MLQSGRKNIETSAEDLRFGDMTEIFVGDFMGQDAAELVVGGPVQEPHGDIELTIACVSRVDLGLIDDTEPDLIKTAWTIHPLQQRNHDAA